MKKESAEKKSKEDSKLSRPAQNIVDEQSNMYLTFSIGTESYGIDVGSVVEIIRISTITPIPSVYSFIKGVANLRGKILPVIDFRTRLGLSSMEYDDRTCIVVVQHEEINVGIIVDRVTEVMRIPLSKIEPRPKVSSTIASRFVANIARISDSVKTIVDVAKLLYDLSEKDIESKEHNYLEKMSTSNKLRNKIWNLMGSTL